MRRWRVTPWVLALIVQGDLGCNFLLVENRSGCSAMPGEVGSGHKVVEMVGSEAE
jgi:hypothetical protein